MEAWGRNKINKHAASKIVMNAELENRMKEEQQMWKKHRENNQKSRKPDKKKKSKSSKRKRSPSSDSFSVSSSDNETPQVSTTVYKTSNTNTERWGHAGFMELYPEDVISGNVFTDTDSSEKIRKRKKASKVSKTGHKKGTTNTDRCCNAGFIKRCSEDGLSDNLFTDSDSSVKSKKKKKTKKRKQKHSKNKKRKE